MTTQAVHRAKAWFEQAESDARTAAALLKQPPPLKSRDVGCHVAALCAQAVEKSIKGYVILNGQTPKLSHRADQYLAPLLRGQHLLRHREHHSKLSGMFEPETRNAIRRLIDLTPGTRSDKDVANTEYPWSEAGGVQPPAGASEFSDTVTLSRWVTVARRLAAELHKLGIAVDRFSS
jgi:hypothetical protein